MHDIVFYTMNFFHEAIGNYFSGKNEVAAVYLYGSHSRGTFLPGSDVDIAILLEKAKLFGKIQEDSIVELGRKLRKIIHPVCMNTAGEELLKQIFSKGVCVNVNFPETLSMFKNRSFSMIADYGYYLKMFQTGFVKSMMESIHG